MPASRYELNQMLSKVLAYNNCGKHEEAAAWAKKLIEALKEFLNALK